MKNFRHWSILLLALLFTNISIGQNNITQKNVKATAPFIEDFNASTTKPTGWDANMFIHANHGLNSNGLYKNMYGSGTASECYVTTPEITGIESATELKFDYRFTELAGFPNTGSTLTEGDSIQILVSKDNGTTFEKIGCIDNTNHTTSTDFITHTTSLSSFIGETIKIKLLISSSSDQDYYIDLDNFSVRAPAATPEAIINETSWNTGFVASGENKTSGKFILKNIGINTLTVSEITDISSTEFSTTFDKTAVSLATDETYEFTFTYTPTNSGEDKQTFILTTNGGNVEIELTGINIPDTYIEDSFTENFSLEFWNVDTIVKEANSWKHSTFYGYDDGKSIFLSAKYQAKAYLASEARVITPDLEIVAGDRLYFYAKQNGVDNTLKVQYTTDDETFTDIQTITLTSDFNLYSIDLSTIATLKGNAKIAFYGKTNTASSSIYLDAIKIPKLNISEPPAVATNPAPAHEATNISLNTTLSWKGNITAEGYIVKFGTVGTALEQVADITETTYEITSELQYNTTYYWQIVPHNTAGNTADCPVWSFTTISDPTITTFPYNQSFEGDIYPPNGWIVEVVSNSKASEPNWNSVSAGTSPTCAVQDGSKMIKFNSYDATAGKKARLKTASIDLTSVTNDMRLNFYMYHDGGQSGKKDAVLIQVSEDGTTWTNLGDTIMREAETSEWVNHKVDLTAYTGKTIYIGFLGISAYGNNIYVDNITIEEAPQTPIAELNITEWNTGLVQGEKVSGTFTLKNIGAPTLTVANITDLSSTEFSTSLIAGDISLGTNETYDFTFTYAPTNGGTDAQTVTIETNSGNVVVQLSGIGIPEDYQIEGFENDFLPVGWDADTLVEGGTAWSQYGSYAYEGSKVAKIYAKYGNPYIASEGRLITPDLAISATDKLYFYAKTTNLACALKVEYTTDGETFNELETITLIKEYQLYTIDLSSIAVKGNAKLAFHGITTTASSGIYVDYVVMPKLNITSAPPVAKNPSPAHEATDVLKDVILSWHGDITATGYKVMFGTTEANIAEVSTQTETTYTPITALEFNTTYYWQIIPYNSLGETADCPIWSFTILADPTVTTFPYNESFETTELPLSWKSEVETASTNSTVPKWVTVAYGSSPTVLPQDGERMTEFNSFNTKGNARLVSVPYQLGTTALGLSFYMYHNAATANDKVQVQVSENGTDWTNLGEPILRKGETNEWAKHKVDLSAYVNKTIYIGFLGISDWGNNIFIDNVNIVEPIAKDLAVKDITVSEVIKGLVATTVKANILNEGSENQTNVDVTLTIGDWTSTKQVSVDADATQEVTFDEWTPTATGKFTANIEVKLTGDVNTANDTKTVDGFVVKSKTAYAYTIYSDTPANVPLGTISLDFTTPETITSIATSDVLVAGGAWANGVWFGMTYTSTDNRKQDLKTKAATPENFVTINPETGAMTEVASATTFITDMAYDYTTSTMYGVVNTASKYQLYTINIETGVITQVATDIDKPSYVYTLAADNNGQLYSICGNGKLYKINKTDATLTEVGTLEAGQVNYLQSMAFDHENNILYWCQSNDTNGNLRAIDTQTGKSYLIGQLQENAEVTGFAIPYSINNAPTFTSTAVIVGTANAEYSYSIVATDTDNDDLTITAPTKPDWLTFTASTTENGKATLAGTPTAAGDFEVKLVVSDGTDEAAQEFTIIVAAANNVPTFTSTEVTEGTVNTEYTYSIVATDTDNDDLTITAPTKPEWLNITTGTENGKATLSGTPTTAGDFNVKLVVSDGTDEATQEFTITVAGLTGSPEFTSTAIITGKVDVEYNYSIVATDPDNDDLTITVPTKPEWITLTAGSENGKATLTGTPTAKGDYNVKLIVSDGTNEAVQEFTIAVTGSESMDDLTAKTVIAIYPNPTRGEFNIAIDNKTAKNYTVEVINIQGKMVYSSSLKGSNSYNEKMNISSYGKGVYFVRIKTENNVIVKRIIVQ